MTAKKSVDPRALMYSVLELVAEIDSVSGQYVRDDDGKGIPVFGPLSLRNPKLEPPELGFQYIVPWFYALYEEAGHVGVGFLTERLKTYGLDADDLLTAHPSVVHDLRTYLQHNLSPHKPHDNQIQQNCKDWFRHQCNTPEPGDPRHWQMCLIGLLEEAIAFLGALRECVRRIETDDSRDEILRDWATRRTRYFPPYMYDEVVQQVAMDLGRDELDIVRFRKQHYERWKKEIDLLLGTINFHVEARKLIEHSLLHEAMAVLPITGTDIMEFFSIPPGAKVGEMLVVARQLYNDNPCSKDELLRKLEERLAGTTPTLDNTGVTDSSVA